GIPPWSHWRPDPGASASLVDKCTALCASACCRRFQCLHHIMTTMTPSRDITRLIEIMAALRTPGTGCPWDLGQDFATIAPYTIEEAYEVADAIERDNIDDLREELGDLLLQVVFH